MIFPENNSFLQGLSNQEACERLRSEGYNEIPGSKRRSIISIVQDVLREPMFILLGVCASIYFLLGDTQEALMLAGFVTIVMGITIYQERKTERALEALRDLSSPRALVVRGGEEKRVAGREVVRGDIVLLNEGDRIPADSLLLTSSHLLVDESLLTGESMPVRKVPWDGVTMKNIPGGEDLPFLYSGTLIVQGQGIAQVSATGVHTELGKLGKIIGSQQSEGTLLQIEIQKLVRKIAFLGVVICLFIAVVYGITRGSIVSGILAGITLAMAVLPEEFPVILVIFLALGAWRMSRRDVLTRRMPAVEALGSVTVLCVDKTGTLTLNQIKAREIFYQGSFYQIPESSGSVLPEETHELLEFGILASQKVSFDPVDKAFKEIGDKFLTATEHIHHDWKLVREYPLSRDLLALSHVWQSPDENEYVIAAKGAPEAIADLCHLGEKEVLALHGIIETMANKGFRVLGVAKAYFKRTELPQIQHDFSFSFIGLVGLIDPVRPTVSRAVEECYAAGVRIAMITGDYPGTALSIAQAVGLENPGSFLTGQELSEMSDREILEKIREVNIFARISPEQKLRLVNAFKEQGEVVAMTGDGVNDAPALKSAHVGIAMGARGTDVAREAADLVLLNDDFSSIVEAIRMGRRIFDNLKKAIVYVCSIHIPIAGISLIPVLLHWPLVLLPIHIAFLELIIDPACSVVFEAEGDEQDVMKRPPRDLKKPLFGSSLLLLSFFQGIGILAIIVGLFSFVFLRGLGENEARSFAFMTLVVANIGLIMVNRSWKKTITATLLQKNKAFWWVAGGASFVLWCVFSVPSLRTLFHFSEVHIPDVAVCISAGILSVIWFEFLKMMPFSVTRKISSRSI